LQTVLVAVHDDPVQHAKSRLPQVAPPELAPPDIRAPPVVAPPVVAPPVVAPTAVAPPVVAPPVVAPPVVAPPVVAPPVPTPPPDIDVAPPESAVVLLAFVPAAGLAENSWNPAICEHARANHGKTAKT